MRLMTKWLIASGILIVLGVVICLVTFKFTNFNFTSFNSEEYVTESFDVNDTFSSIDVSSVRSDVKLLPADGKECKVVFLDTEDATHEVHADNGTLYITAKAPDKIQSFGINVQSPCITVYLPESKYKDFTVSTTSGDVNLPGDFSFNNINIAGNTTDVKCAASVKETLVIGLTTGDVELNDVAPEKSNISVNTGDLKLHSYTGGDIELKLTTGDVTLDHVNVEGVLSITGITGDISFIESDAQSIYVKVNTGDIKGTILTDKQFKASTKIGDTKVPDSKGDKTCELHSNTGDIEIEIGD